MNQIDARLQEIARDVFNNDSLFLSDSTKPGDVSGWDSLGHVNFMLSIESEFDIEFSEDDLVRFADIGELKQILAEKIVKPSATEAV